jgi:RNA polymerase sigma factor (sigma-70 family)
VRPRGEEELRRVFREHVDAVYAFFGYSVRGPAAEDLTSATFERVVKAWRSYDRERASERTWILAIARNLLADHFRRERHRVATSLDEHPQLLDALVETGDPLAAHLSAEAVKEWLLPLAAREREILALRYGADLQPAEIAAMLDLTIANVHQILSRTLRRLRERAEAGTA